MLSGIWSQLFFFLYCVSLALHSPGPGQVKCRMLPLLLLLCIYYDYNLQFSLKCSIIVMHVHFGHLMQRTDPLEETLMLGKMEGRRREWQRMR